MVLRITNGNGNDKDAGRDTFAVYGQHNIDNTRAITIVSTIVSTIVASWRLSRIKL